MSYKIMKKKLVQDKQKIYWTTADICKIGKDKELKCNIFIS